MRWKYDPDMDEASFEHKGRRGMKNRGKMPVSSEARAKGASKQTHASKQASKKTGRSGSGFRHRRHRRIE